MQSKPPGHRPRAERDPDLRYLCRDQEEIYELYDDVEPPDNPSPSRKGTGLLVAGLSPGPDHLPGHLGTIRCKAICFAMRWPEAKGQSVSLATRGEKAEGRDGPSERPYQPWMGATASERGVARSAAPGGGR